MGEQMITPLLILDSREEWHPSSVEMIPKVGGARINGEPIDLNNLPDGGHLDFPANMTQPICPLVGYHRVADGGGLVWHQFWFWYFYNPKKYAGFGEHEGDWEMVQIGCKDELGDEPVLVTCSQHDGGEKREFWRVELGIEGRPAIYVARDSHANYFAPQRDVTDQVDGKGEQLITIEWHAFGEWALWNGQWGNSSNSPGPLTTRRAWTAPHAWHGQAR
jgi:hypothetical protein